MSTEKDTQTEAWVDAWIAHSWRDVADQDYVAARIAYRYELTQPFLWSSQQAVEKYLKAILLFSRVDTRDLGHDVVKVFGRLRTIPDLPFNFPPDIEKFIEYINEEGPNRYDDYPRELRPDALIGLDRSAWHLRRYCDNLRGPHLAEETTKLAVDPLQQRRTFSIGGGWLEKVLAKRSATRAHLVWKNFWYGSRPKRRIKRFPARFSWTQPLTFMRPEVYEVVKDLVKLPPDVRAHLEALRKQKP